MPKIHQQKSTILTLSTGMDLFGGLIQSGWSQGLEYIFHVKTTIDHFALVKNWKMCQGPNWAVPNVNLGHNIRAKALQKAIERGFFWTNWRVTRKGKKSKILSGWEKSKKKGNVQKRWSLFHIG